MLFNRNSSFCGGVWACAASFSTKDFEILDLDPPNSPTSYYGACHFGYNIALMVPSFKLSKILTFLVDQFYLVFPCQFFNQVLKRDLSKMARTIVGCGVVKKV